MFPPIKAWPPRKGGIRSWNSDAEGQLLANVRRVVAVGRVDVSKTEFVDDVGAEDTRVTNGGTAWVVDIVTGTESRRIVGAKPVGDGEVIVSEAVAEKERILFRGDEVSTNVEVIEVPDALTLGPEVLQDRACNVWLWEGLQIL